MRLLVVGENGLLGSGVVAAAQEREWSVSGTYHSDASAADIESHQLDIRDTDEFESIIDEVEPAAVINCAAMTDVDGCESEPVLAMEVNGRAPGDMAAVCASHDVHFCHVSTDYVFDGERRRPYPEEAEPNPVQVYGETKLAGEQAVAEAPGSQLVVRLAFVYGIHGASAELQGFPAWVGERLETGVETALFRDQSVTPTRSGHAAEAILELLESGGDGLLHVASRSCMTPYDFGLAVARRRGSDESLLRPGSMSEVERPARRPPFSCLDVNTVEEVLGRPQPTLEEDLDAVDQALAPA